MNYDALLGETIAGMSRDFPGFCVIHKRGHRLSHVIDVLLRLLTLGAQSEYITRYHTVLGNRLYVPDTWDATPSLERVITLRHERVHLEQRRRYGDVLMVLLYALPFFPLGLAYGRARIEWEAYTETLRATAELKGLAAAESSVLRIHIVRQFTSGAYGWMWPFPSIVEKWYESALKGIRAQAAQRPQLDRRDKE